MRIHHRDLRGSGGPGAVRFLLTGSWKETEEIMTPKGILVAVSLEEKSSGDGWAECAVRKDAGDDYDVTNGILVYARAEKEPPGLRLEDGSQQEKEKPDQQNAEYSETLIEIDGGIGIGRDTKPGLDQPVGAAAINSVPRKMIRDAVYALLEEAGGVSSGIDHNISSCRRGGSKEDLQPGPRHRGRDLCSRNKWNRGAYE